MSDAFRMVLPGDTP